MGSNVQKFNRAVLTLPMNLSKDHIHCCKSTYPIDQATEGQIKNIIRVAFGRNKMLQDACEDIVSAAGTAFKVSN